MDRLISEKAVLECLRKNWLAGTVAHRVIDELADAIKAIPSAEPKVGQWITEDMFDGDVAYRCSECNELFWIEVGTPKDNGYNFCPKCGKRLVEEQESEDKE